MEHDVREYFPNGGYKTDGRRNIPTAIVTFRRPVTVRVGRFTRVTLSTTLSWSSDMGTWKREDHQGIQDGRLANKRSVCNVDRLQENGPSINLPET